MKILEPSDDRRVTYRSSISQNKNTLSVMKRGEWVPISFDALDYIDCKGVKTHLATVTDGDDIGFDFPVGECCQYTDTYIYHDENMTELRKMPEWFGAGYYEEVLSKHAFINTDNEALGERNFRRLRIGLSYALADKNLPPVE